ncbi:MAG: MBOAT family protein [Saprospiraceae bacterium]|jgi:alginate O-acetyltransferase complex protein AlgI|nr:MBOAT family protein [Saprospiraceae bacterium]
MVFSSTTFLFAFLPVVLLGHALLRGIPGRNAFLLAFSLLFYAWGEGWGLILMLCSIALNYASGLLIERQPAHARRWLIMALVVNLGLLVGFKYANFLVDNLNMVLLWNDLPALYLAPVHLPVGISFFTFQALSYVVDVYRGETPAQRNPLRIALYISLFPQLIAGPIVRYVDVRDQMAGRRVSADDFALGIERFIVGLAKKILLADTLAYTADKLFEAPADALGASAAWLGVVCYAFQIYFDFSGYSDMAIGMGRMLGFHFLENFRFPYFATSVQDFWRRWHISLSTWFRDYLYIPLGGNRRGEKRTFANLLLVFFLCGLWHGASWNFVIWGLFHGTFLILERSAWGRLLQKLPLLVRHAYLILTVLIGWVFFRADSLAQAIDYLKAMVGANTAPTYYAGLFLNIETMLTLAAAAFLSLPYYARLAARIEAPAFGTQWPRLIHRSALIGLFALSVITLINSTYNPFIYFRF